MSRKWIARVLLMALCLGISVTHLGGHVQAQKGHPVTDPEADLEFTLYMVEGLRTGAEQTLPEELAPAMGEVRTAYPYKAYRLLDTNVMRKSLRAEGRLGGALPSVIKVLDNATTPYYALTFRGGALVKWSPGDLSLGYLELTAQTPYSRPTIIGDTTLTTTSWRSSGFTVGVDADLGEKVLLGKINVAGEGTNGRPSNAIFFILEVNLAK